MQILKNFLWDIYRLYLHVFLGDLFAAIDRIRIGAIQPEVVLLPFFAALGCIYLLYADRSWSSQRLTHLRRRDLFIGSIIFTAGVIASLVSMHGIAIPEPTTMVTRDIYNLVIGGLGISFLLFLIIAWTSIPTVLFYIWLGIERLIPRIQTKKMERSIVIGVALFCLLHLAAGFFSVFVEPNIAGSNFFVLHAAIQNTCLLDRKREHCPHTVEEISYIEPEEYARRSKEAQLYYQYYPDTNEYVFMARYAPDKIALFGNRLQRFTGSDYQEYNVETFGRDRIIDPPAFDGPWNQIREWDK